MATITGRAGIAVNNNLFYVKGGYAGVNNRLAVSDTVPANVGSGSSTQWHHGWTVGAGWEYGITANWIVGLEYDYSQFERKTYQLAGAAVGTYAFDSKPRDIQSAVVRLSYKFGGPVVPDTDRNTPSRRESPGVSRGFFVRWIRQGPVAGCRAYPSP